MHNHPNGWDPNCPSVAILESISDGVFTVDSEWRITSFNRAAERITGIPRSEAVGSLCSEVFRSSMCGPGCALKQTLQQGKSIVGKTAYIVSVDGEKIPISVSTAILRDSKGRAVGGAETFRDLTEIETLRQELHGQVGERALQSSSPAMRHVLGMLGPVADSLSTVLIHGETGTGKEVLARTLHEMGPRQKGPFVALNCGAIPDTLLESELFGYLPGAFTGAQHAKSGRFAQAKGGTLFLDEVGEVSAAMQVRLLRVLQDREYQPLGATHTEKADVRIIAATHRDLSRAVQEGSFREDLYYRLHVIRLDLPPLRERKEDIPMLLQQFIARFNSLQGAQVQGVSPELMSLLMVHDWPGNVRELENLVERCFVVCRQGLLELSHLPDHWLAGKRTAQEASGLDQMLGHVESQAIIAALRKHGNNRSQAAKELGMHRSTFFRKLRRLGIDPH